MDIFWNHPFDRTSSKNVCYIVTLLIIIIIHKSLFTSETTEDNKNEGLDLNIIPATETLGNEYLMEKKRLAEAQGKRHKPTRASWAKSLDDDDNVCQSCYYNLYSGTPFIRSRMGQKNMAVFYKKMYGRFARQPKREAVTTR